MPPKSSKRHLEWFAKAGEDELSICAVLKDGAPSTACFLSQQMAEKYLKGLAVYHNKSFPKVHDLLVLETLVMEIEPGISVIHEDIKHLNRYYIETRYPGDYPQFTKEEALAAYRSAERVKEFVLSKTNP